MHPRGRSSTVLEYANVIGRCRKPSLEPYSPGVCERWISLRAWVSLVSPASKDPPVSHALGCFWQVPRLSMRRAGSHQSGGAPSFCILLVRGGYLGKPHQSCLQRPVNKSCSGLVLAVGIDATPCREHMQGCSQTSPISDSILICAVPSAYICSIENLPEIEQSFCTFHSFIPTLTRFSSLITRRAANCQSSGVLFNWAESYLDWRRHD